MKKHKYVAAKCHACQCGNFNRRFKNNCRAISGLVPGSWQDCYAFMTVAEAGRVDRIYEDEQNERKNIAK